VIALLILVRIAASAWMNVLQKKLASQQVDPLLIVTATFIFLTFLVLPLLLFYPLWGLSTVFWLNMLGVALLDAPGNFFLVKAVKLSELSVFGPLNSYKPVVAMFVGFFFLNEIPTLQGLAGVVIIVVGSFLLSPAAHKMESRANLSWWKEQGTLYRLLSLVMTACSSIFLKAASQEASPMHTFVAWAVTGAPVAIVCLKLFTPVRVEEIGQEMKKRFASFLWLGILFLVLQILTLYLFAMMKVAYALALFQLNALAHVFLGWKIFREKNILPRALGSAIMLAGAVILILA